MKLELAMAGIGMALVLVSTAARGSEIPAVVDVRSGVINATLQPSAPAISTLGSPKVLGTSAFDELSPGNRLIARALYAAQKAGAVNGRQPWSLEQIAAARTDGRNWGQIFQRLKAETLLEAETLGQVVTWYQYHNVTPEPLRSGSASSAVVVPASRNQTAP